MTGSWPRAIAMQARADYCVTLWLPFRQVLICINIDIDIAGRYLRLLW